MGVTLVALVVGVPALAFTLWPILRRHGDRRTFLPLAPDPREHLVERKRQALRALRELAFEHEAGHISDDDYAGLRTRYEAEAAAVIAELDRLGAPAPPPEPAAAPAPPRAGAWRRPLALGGAAVLLVVFGMLLGAGIVRHSAPDSTAGLPVPGSRPLAALEPPAPAGAARPGPGGGRALSPAMLRGMLEAARASLVAGRYDEAIAAYKAVLARDPDNVDALTHLGLIVAIGGHTDAALEAFDKALAIEPDYPPALLYRGQVLLEGRRDVAGAIASWERFVAVVPPGEDRARVERLLAEARAGRAPAASR